MNSLADYISKNDSDQEHSENEITTDYSDEISYSLSDGSADFEVDPNFSQKYLVSVNKKLKVHGKKFIIGDEVYLAYDFDANQQTKKSKFQSFFRTDILKVTNVSDENADKSIAKYVSASRLKKVKNKN